MSSRPTPTWDVEGQTTARFNLRDRLFQFSYHVKFYEDGHGALMVDGIWHPIARGMTVAEYFDTLWGAALERDQTRARASGD